VSRKNGTRYRSKSTGIEARLIKVKYPKARCEGRGERLDPGTDVLGVPPDEPKNDLGRWRFCCLTCAQDTDYEPADKKIFGKSVDELFPVRTESSEREGEGEPAATVRSTAADDPAALAVINEAKSHGVKATATDDPEVDRAEAMRLAKAAQEAYARGMRGGQVTAVIGLGESLGFLAPAQGDDEAETEESEGAK